MNNEELERKVLRDLEITEGFVSETHITRRRKDAARRFKIILQMHCPTTFIRTLGTETDAIFEYIQDIAAWGERGADNADNTRAAIVYVLHAFTKNSDPNYVLIHSYLIRTFPLVRFEFYRMPSLKEKD